MWINFLFSHILKAGSKLKSAFRNGLAFMWKLEEELFNKNSVLNLSEYKYNSASRFLSAKIVDRKREKST